MELYKVSTKYKLCGSDNLYLRIRSGAIERLEDVYILQPDTEISTDTYFNLFSSSKYGTHTSAKKITIMTVVSGDIEVELRYFTKHTDKRVDSRKITSDAEAEVSFTFDISDLDDSEPVCHYILYRSIKASKIYSFGSYMADSVPNLVNLGVVICTFRRELRAMETLDRIAEIMLSEEYVTPELTVYLVDNGKTIENQDIRYDFVKLIPNENTGGSGGYTRGMLEARNEQKTHILLMDDDVYIDPNVIYKTVNFISILNEDRADSFILGGMLLPESPTVQYEAGAEWLPDFRGRKSMLDLSEKESLLLNDKREPAQYGGWWYQCMPVSATDKLPLPFFIKMDDVLFGMMRMNNHVVMNGIGIWHDSFESKINPVVDFYFLRRNGLILDSIFNRRNGFRIGAYYMRILLHCIKKQGNKEYFFTKMAIEDFLKGPDMFSTVKGEDILSIPVTNYFEHPDSKNPTAESLLKNNTLKEIHNSIRICLRLSTEWNSVSENYKKNIHYYSSEEFWRNI